MAPDKDGFPLEVSEAFDFSTDGPLDWEIDLIKRAVKNGRYLLTPHAQSRIIERGISASQVRQVILDGQAVSKDCPGNPINRAPGLNFEGTINDGRTIRVKVIWQGRYMVVTAHEV